MAEVVLRNVTKSFGATRRSSDVTMTVPDGAFVVLLGPTGAGKTTTPAPDRGARAARRGRHPDRRAPVTGDTPAQRDVAMVFQQYSLYPHMTVRDNLAFPLRSPMLRTPEPEIARKVQEVAEVCASPTSSTTRPRAVGRRDAARLDRPRAGAQPAIYLMDEPLSSLDAKLRADLRVELKRIQTSLGATFLYVTHDQIEAMTMATHVGVLDEGRLVQFGTPREIYENPVSLYVAGRLGQPRINLLPAALFGGAPPGARQIGLRPEHIRQGEGRPRTVVRVEHLGDQTRLHLTLGGHDLVTLTDPTPRSNPGDTCRIEPRNPLWFDATARGSPEENPR
jgi:multiple sugar transport system ATP-binding protein